MIPQSQVHAQNITVDGNSLINEEKNQNTELLFINCSSNDFSTNGNCFNSQTPTDPLDLRDNEPKTSQSNEEFIETTSPNIDDNLASKLTFQRTNNIKKRKCSNKCQKINSFNSLEMPFTSLPSSCTTLNTNKIELNKLRSKSMINYDYHLFTDQQNIQTNNTSNNNDSQTTAHNVNNKQTIISSRSTLLSTSRSTSTSPSSMISQNNIIEITSSSSSSSSSTSSLVSSSPPTTTGLSNTQTQSTISTIEQQQPQEASNQNCSFNINSKYLSNSVLNILASANDSNTEVNNNDITEDRLFFENISKG